MEDREIKLRCLELAKEIGVGKSPDQILSIAVQFFEFCITVCYEKNPKIFANSKQQ